MWKTLIIYWCALLCQWKYPHKVCTADCGLECFIFGNCKQPWGLNGTVKGPGPRIYWSLVRIECTIFKNNPHNNTNWASRQLDTWRAWLAEDGLPKGHFISSDKSVKAKKKKENATEEDDKDEEDKDGSEEVEVIANTPEPTVKEIAEAAAESDTEEENNGEIEDNDKNRNKEIKLIKKEQKNKNKALKTLIKMFKKKLDFERTENIMGYMDADSAQLKKWVDKL